MNEDLVTKFEQFDPGQLYVMITCFGSPDRTLLYQHALEALRRTRPDMAERFDKRKVPA